MNYNIWHLTYLALIYLYYTYYSKHCGHRKNILQFLMSFSASPLLNFQPSHNFQNSRCQYCTYQYYLLVWKKNCWKI